MTDWRDVRMAEIDWGALRKKIGRSAGTFRRYSAGEWCELTLGEVADMGRAQLLRQPEIGPITIDGLQAVIDMAAAGALPIGGRAAPDALRPSAEAVRGDAK